MLKADHISKVITKIEAALFYLWHGVYTAYAEIDALYWQSIR